MLGFKAASLHWVVLLSTKWAQCRVGKEGARRIRDVFMEMTHIWSEGVRSNVTEEGPEGKRNGLCKDVAAMSAWFFQRIVNSQRESRAEQSRGA